MRNFWKKWKIYIFPVMGIFVTAIFLRIYHLTKIPVFVDEAIYIRWAQVMRAEETLRFLPLSDGKQPLFMWVVIPFLKIFSDPLFAGRLVSVMTGLGTITGIFVLSYLLFSSIELAIISSFLYSISPFTVFFDRLALSDSMLSFFGVWTIVFAVITVKKVRLDAAMLSGFSLGGALLTKSPAIYFALMTPLTLILGKWPKKTREKFYKLSVYLFLFFFTFSIAFAIYNILRLGTNFHMIAIRNKDYVYPINHIFSTPFDPLKPFLDRTLQYFWILGTFEAVILFIIGLFSAVKDHKKELFLLLILFLLPIFISSEYSKTMTARYVYFSVPYFFVIASLALRRGFKVTYQSRLGKIVVVLFGLLAVHSVLTDVGLLRDPEKVNLPRSERSGYLEEWTSGYGIKEVSEYLKESLRSGQAKKIVVGTEGYFGTLPDGLQIYLNDTPAITVVGVGVPVKELPVSLIESEKAGNDTYLVVNDSRIKFNADKNGLDLIAKYPKAIKPDGSRENMLFYKLTGESVRSSVN